MLRSVTAQYQGDRVRPVIEIEVELSGQHQYLAVILPPELPKTLEHFDLITQGEPIAVQAPMEGEAPSGILETAGAILPKKIVAPGVVG